MLYLKGNTAPAYTEHNHAQTVQPAPGVSVPTLWTPSERTATLLEQMSDELGLDWNLNHPSRPDILVLTNLGRSNPKRLVARCRPLGVILCLDDRAGRDFMKSTDLPCFTYSEGRDEANLTAHSLRSTEDGLSFVVGTREELARVVTPVDSLYTALSVLACTCAFGVDLGEAASALTVLLCGSDKTACMNGKTL